MPQLVIKSHRPWQLAIAIIALSTVVSLLTWLLLDRSHWQLILDRSGTRAEVRRLHESNRSLARENKDLRDQMLMLEQTTKVDKETAVLMQSELKSLQDEIHDLKRELEFYQGVMDAARQVTDLDVHGLYLEPLPRGQYLMKLVLTHVAKNDNVIKGALAVTLEGIGEGGRQQLDLQSLLIDGTGDLSFELKNFKQLEYRFALPDGFIADRVVVQVKPSDRKVPGLSRDFDWPVGANMGSVVDVER